MKTSFFWIAVLLLTLSVQSCRNGKSAWLPTATGAANEVLVVMSEKLQESPAGTALFDVLDADIPGLPQSEPFFRYYPVTPVHFDNILKPSRNIVIVELSDLLTQPRISYERDVWARPQTVLYIKSPDAAQLQAFVEKNAGLIQDFFVRTELARSVEYLKETYNSAASDSLSAQMGITARVPSELTATKKGKDFFWASNAKDAGRLDFVVYSVPYTSQDQFDLDRIVATRDSVMKANIPGALPGSFMKTQLLYPPSYRVLNLNGKFAAEVRGLWDVQGAVMGGPFVSITRLDELNHRIITTEVFVYNPAKGKRNLLRRLEGALYTVQLPQETRLPEIPIVFEAGGAE